MHKSYFPTWYKRRDNCIQVYMAHYVRTYNINNYAYTYNKLASEPKKCLCQSTMYIAIEK